MEAFLEDTSLDGEQCVQSSGSNTPQAYCVPDRMTKFSRLSRFGMTFKPLTADRGKALLTLYLAAFHAKTLAQQGKAQGLTESAAECGNTWRGLLAKYDPDTHSLRTAQCSLFEDLTESCVTLPRWGSMRSGGLYQRLIPAHLISETESGLWPTPTTAQGGPNHNSPQVLKGNHGINLSGAVSRWPSPKARDWKDGRSAGTKNRDSPDLGKVVGQSLQSGALNPTWVEWLMGWPLGLTDLKPLGMDRFQEWQQQHLES